MNLELKEMFFGIYWNQEYIYYNNFGTFKGSLSDGNSIYNFRNNVRNEKACLLLKDVSKISNEDLDFIYSNKIMNEDELITDKISNFCSSDTYLSDYLRSKGYALPFMEYSVEDLVSFGWILLQADA